MTERKTGSVVIRTGRPSTRDRVYAVDDVVRFDARIPALLAKRLYDAAHESGRPVTAVHADLLAKALDDVDGAAMG
ncbi:mechanosensitive ion channel protein MscS [Isoptericola halotolerans]|uniref:mechanosensitive ion channel protein MscS n=1 Tax=Isoptericola halotolerans TaxID=300560 RepID=UPI00388E9B99